MLLFIFILLEN